MSWDVPGGPVVKSPPSNTGDMASRPVGELRSHMPRGNHVHALQLEKPHVPWLEKVDVLPPEPEMSYQATKRHGGATKAHC